MFSNRCWLSPRVPSSPSSDLSNFQSINVEQDVFIDPSATDHADLGRIQLSPCNGPANSGGLTQRSQSNFQSQSNPFSKSPVLTAGERQQFRTADDDVISIESSEISVRLEYDDGSDDESQDQLSLSPGGSPLSPIKMTDISVRSYSSYRTNTHYGCFHAMLIAKSIL